MLCFHQRIEADPSAKPHVSSTFYNDRTGAAAVEFGLIGGLFLLLICFWIELGLTLFLQAALDRAVRKEARQIKVGVITGDDESSFKADLCADLSSVMNCSKITYNVASSTSFTSLQPKAATINNGALSLSGFDPCKSGQDVIVQVGYARTLFLPLVAPFLGKNGNLLIMSSLAFQNEPF